VIQEGDYPFGQGVWDDTHIFLPEGVSHSWENVITNQYVDNGKKLLIGEVLTHFPVALLMREETI
jgi:(1->4)-alpha-D-glucan 1-alpha-D-glucosylmutase